MNKKLNAHQKKLKLKLPKALTRFAVVLAVLTALLVGWFLLTPPLSDETTRAVSGEVTGVRLRRTFGLSKWSWDKKKAVVKLESGEEYEFLYDLLTKRGISYEEFEEAALGEHADMRYCPTRSHTAVTVRIGEREFVTYDDSNGIRDSHIMGMWILYAICVVLAASLIWLIYLSDETIFAIADRMARKNVKKRINKQK